MTSAPIPTIENTSRTAPLRSFVITLAICWLALGAAAWSLARERRVPAEIAAPVALAFLTEISFYLLSGFQGLRERMAANYSRQQIASAMTIAAFLPYVIYAYPTGHFAFMRSITLWVIMTAVSFWYVPVIRSRRVSIARDILFLVIVAGAILSGVFKWIYPDVITSVPDAITKVPMETLGHLTLVRCAILSILVIRRADKITFGFIPTAREFRIGLLWAVVCTAASWPVGTALGQVHLSKHTWHPLQMALQLLGIFWFVALSEEFFFRALLQQWIASWSGSVAGGMLTASAIYGLCHLKFPNWRFAILAGILGLFCGIAFQQARSMRASMITHTLVAGAFRLLLT